jgi:rhomboid family GlyGly-CTERM serine protease
MSCAPGLTGLLQYDRGAVAAGQVWRLLTWHWTHWSTDHLFWDGLAFVVLGVCCERLGRGRTLACLGLAVLTVSAATLAARPDLNLCRGLSGIDAALFGLASVLAVRAAWARGARGQLLATGGLLAGFAGKIAFEALTGSTVFVASARAGMVAMPLAHCVGFVSGALVGVAGSSHSSSRCSSSPEPDVSGDQERDEGC